MRLDGTSFASVPAMQLDHVALSQNVTNATDASRALIATDTLSNPTGRLDKQSGSRVGSDLPLLVTNPSAEVKVEVQGNNTIQFRHNKDIGVSVFDGGIRH